MELQENGKMGCEYFYAGVVAKFKSIETFVQNGFQTSPDATSSHRWRKENNNLWRLMNYVVTPRIEVDRKVSGLLLDTTATRDNFFVTLNPNQLNGSGFCNTGCS